MGRSARRRERPSECLWPLDDVHRGRARMYRFPVFGDGVRRYHLSYYSRRPVNMGRGVALVHFILYITWQDQSSLVHVGAQVRIRIGPSGRRDRTQPNNRWSSCDRIESWRGASAAVVDSTGKYRLNAPKSWVTTSIFYVNFSCRCHSCFEVDLMEIGAQTFVCLRVSSTQCTKLKVMSGRSVIYDLQFFVVWHYHHRGSARIC
jgi:hypothetical protein